MPAELAATLAARQWLPEALNAAQELAELLHPGSPEEGLGAGGPHCQSPAGEAAKLKPRCEWGRGRPSPLHSPFYSPALRGDGGNGMKRG